MRGRTYEQFLDPFHKPQKINLANELPEIIDFATRLAHAKKDEPNRRFDLGSLIRRTTTGHMGEWALEKLFRKKFVDRVITKGNSFIHDFPDLRNLGIECGVKTCEWLRARVWDLEKSQFVYQDRFPILRTFKDTLYPQIFCFRQGSDILISGVASVQALKKFQDYDLIENPEIVGKTGFWGFHEVQPFSTLEELCQLLQKKRND